VPIQITGRNRVWPWKFRAAEPRYRLQSKKEIYLRIVSPWRPRGGESTNCGCTKAPRNDSMAHWHAYSLRLRAADLDPVEPLEAAAPPPVTSLLQVRAASKKLLPPGIRHLQVLPAKLEQLQQELRSTREQGGREEWFHPLRRPCSATGFRQEKGETGEWRLETTAYILVDSYLAVFMMYFVFPLRKR
jgi:hypothetical protein